jgi:hypothetical protein
LTYSLLSSPGGATVNATNGIFTFRPAIHQANSTNLTMVEVIDNGSPPLSATQGFNVIVNPFTAPVLTVKSLTNGILTLSASGQYGPDFTMQGSSNLLNWTSLYTTSSPALPLIWSDTNAYNYTNRYYRALLGP